MPLLRFTAKLAASALVAGIAIVTLSAGSAGADTVIRKPQSVVGQLVAPDNSVIRKPQ